MSISGTASVKSVPTARHRRRERRRLRPALVLTALLPLLTPAAPAASEVPPDRRELALTLYRGGVALVRDRREADIPAGEREVRWYGVAPGLHAGSVYLDGVGVTLRGFRLEHEPWSLAGLVEAHVGREVRVVRGSGNEREEIRARVLSAEPLLLENVTGVFSARPEQLVYPGGPPPGMGEDPALLLETTRAAEGEAAFELHYLAEGFDWSAEHVAVLSPERSRMDLLTRARIHNGSGMAVSAARVDLIAGEVNIPRERERPAAQLRMMRADAAESAAEVVPESAGEQYRFRLPRQLTLADGDSRGVRLQSHDGIAVKRIHAVSAAARPHGRTGADGWQTVPVETRLEWEQPDGPLPAGPIRVYEREGDGLRLLGGDRVPDRPEGERVRIIPGRPFDLTARRRQTEFRRIDSGRYEMAHEIRLYNASEDTARILVEEAIPGEWQMLEASHEWERAASNLAVWRLEVPAGAELSLKYNAKISQ